MSLSLAKRINRKCLDFDKPYICSETLSSVNVYCCLECGAFLSGRQADTPAYNHSIDNNHHLYVSLTSLKAYVLPQNMVFNENINDIICNIRPSINHKSIEMECEDRVDVHGRKFIIGYLGLFKYKRSDYINTVIQLLAHIPPIRNMLLFAETETSNELFYSFRKIIQKIWNPSSFTSCISLQSTLEVITRHSQNKFQIIKQGDPIELLTWLIHTLNIGHTFRGSVKVGSMKIDELSMLKDMASWKTVPFYHLTLELPAKPMFVKEAESDTENAKHEVTLEKLFSKFDGGTMVQKGNYFQSFILQSLPSHLVLYYKRFTFAHDVLVKNQCHVSFPLQSLSVSAEGSKEKSHFDLCCNICHEGGALEGTYFIQIRTNNSCWIEIRDEKVTKIHPSHVRMSPCVLQVWEKV